MKFLKLNCLILIFVVFASTAQYGLSQTGNVLNAPFNSDLYQTVSPYVSYDESRFVFIKVTDDKRELAESYIQANGTWTNPITIDAINYFDSLEFKLESPSYNHNTTEIYLSIKPEKTSSGSDIYVSKRIKGEWKKPKILPSEINSDYHETDPFLSADGNFLYFARSKEKPGQKGSDCYQLYVSQKKDGIWQAAVPLPNPLNSGCERCPRLAPDGKTLYFTSLRDDEKTHYDLYYSKKITKNAWTTPSLLDTLNNTGYEMFPINTHYGHKLYFLKGDEKGKEESFKLYSAKLDAQFHPESTLRIYGRVTDLQSGEPLEAQIHIIDPNTSVITAVSNTDGENGTYSFYLEKDKKYRIKVFNDNYSNYFFTYNTDYLSSFEKIEKNIELYSKVRLVLNVYDSEIFEPLNAEINVFNNSSNETYNILVKPIEKGMYSLHLPIGNVYKIEAKNSHFEKDSFILDLSGVVQFSEFERDMELNVKKVDYVFNITNEETGEGVEAVVEIINLSTNEKIIKKVKTDKDGKLKIKLRDGTRYEINITPQGYAFYNTTVDLVDEEANYVTDAKLTPLRKQTKLELNNIYFETNSADLNKASFEELNRLVKLLQNNPQIQIEISAHTDDLGSEVYNLKLSDRRANSVKEYLFAKEISENQIISKGYGESKPAYLPVNTDENRAKNRRVELEVIDVKEE